VCGDAALYADPFDADAWSQSIRAALDDDATRQSLIAAGRRQAGTFTWKQAARNLFDAVKAVTPV
jgi:glycosyltransferase involved in cell wall biosynthesis